MAAIIWYAGQELIPGQSVMMRGFDEAANELYTISYEGPATYRWPRFVMADKKGHLYVAWHNGSGVGYPTYPIEWFRKYRQNGDRIPFPDLGYGHITAMAIAPSDGSIYIGGGVSDTYPHWLRKYDSSGSLLWQKTCRDLPSNIAMSAAWIRLDSSENVVFAGRTVDSGSELTKYAADGTLIWSKTLTGGIDCLALDASDNIYTGGPSGVGYFEDGDYFLDQFYVWGAGLIQFFDGTKSILKWNSSGVYQGGYSPPGGELIKQIEHANGLLYFVGEDGSQFRIVASVTTGFASYTSIRTLQVIYDLTQSRHYISVKNDGTIYAITMSGAFNSAASRSGSVFVIEDVELPSLDISFSLKAPTWQGDLYAIVPPLAVRFGVKAPITTLDYVGGEFLPQVFRLYLTGTPTIELQLASISCRRGYGTVALSVVCPYLTSTQITEIEARLTTGELVIKRGIRFAGYEQTDEMLRVPIQSLRWDAGANNASATLSGQTTETANAKTRTVTGISYRNLYQGNRRIRCAVDTYLRPGDTADLGSGETMTVASIVYSIYPDNASMEISE